MQIAEAQMEPQFTITEISEALERQFAKDDSFHFDTQKQLVNFLRKVMQERQS